MTKIEQQELAELGSSPEQIAERQMWATKLLHGPEKTAALMEASPNDDGRSIYDKPARRTRSDKGTKKPRKGPTPAQTDKLDDLDAAVLRLLQANAALQRAEIEHHDATGQYTRILEALKGKQ
jgi:hypothetical protein